MYVEISSPLDAMHTYIPIESYYTIKDVKKQVKDKFSLQLDLEKFGIQLIIEINKDITTKFLGDEELIADVLTDLETQNNLINFKKKMFENQKRSDRSLDKKIKARRSMTQQKPKQAPKKLHSDFFQNITNINSQFSYKFIFKLRVLPEFVPFNLETLNICYNQTLEQFINKPFHLKEQDIIQLVALSLVVSQNDQMIDQNQEKTIEKLLPIQYFKSHKNIDDLVISINKQFQSIQNQTQFQAKYDFLQYISQFEEYLCDQYHCQYSKVKIVNKDNENHLQDKIIGDECELIIKPKYFFLFKDSILNKISYYYYSQIEKFQKTGEFFIIITNDNFKNVIKCNNQNEIADILFLFQSYSYQNVVQ